MKPALDLRVVQGAWVLVFGIAFMATWQLGYAPTQTAIRCTSEERAALQARLTRAETMVQTGGGRDAWLAAQQELLNMLAARVPEQARLPELLNAIDAIARANDVTVLSLIQGNLEPVLQDDQPVRMGGMMCSRLPVTLTVEGRYHAMRSVLAQLTDTAFPGVMQVQQVELVRSAADDPRLTATLHLILYVTVTSGKG